MYEYLLTVLIRDNAEALLRNLAWSLYSQDVTFRVRGNAVFVLCLSDHHFAMLKATLEKALNVAL
jgi:hypothetical protein